MYREIRDQYTDLFGTVDSPSAIVGLPNVPWTSITDSTKTEELLPASVLIDEERSAPEDTDRYPVT